jgi:hypothetical protein
MVSGDLPGKRALPKPFQALSRTSTALTQEHHQARLVLPHHEAKAVSCTSL